MTDPEKMKPTSPDPDAERVPDLPPDEQPDDADRRTDLTPEGQRSRPEQPGFDPSEVDQFQTMEDRSAPSDDGT